MGAPLAREPSLVKPLIERREPGESSLTTP